MEEHLFIVSKICGADRHTPVAFLSFREGNHFVNDRVGRVSMMDGWTNISAGDVVVAIPNGQDPNGDTRYWRILNEVVKMKSLIIPNTVDKHGRVCDEGYIESSREASRALPGEEWKCKIVRISKDGRPIWFPIERIERINLHLQDIEVGDAPEDDPGAGPEMQKLWVVRRVSGHVVLAHNLAHFTPDISEKVVSLRGETILRRTYSFPVSKLCVEDQIPEALTATVQEEIPYKEDDRYGVDYYMEGPDHSDLDSLGYQLVNLADCTVPAEPDLGLARA